MLRLATWAPGLHPRRRHGPRQDRADCSRLEGARDARTAAHHRAGVGVVELDAELARFMPSLKARWYNDERDARRSHALGPGDVLVVSYGLLQRRSVALREAHCATVVIDEAQYVKNVTRAAHRCRARDRRATSRSRSPARRSRTTSASCSASSTSRSRACSAPRPHSASAFASPSKAAA